MESGAELLCAGLGGCNHPGWPWVGGRVGWAPGRHGISAGSPAGRSTSLHVVPPRGRLGPVSSWGDPVTPVPDVPPAPGMLWGRPVAPRLQFAFTAAGERVGGSKIKPRLGFNLLPQPGWARGVGGEGAHTRGVLGTREKEPRRDRVHRLSARHTSLKSLVSPCPKHR